MDRRRWLGATRLKRLTDQTHWESANSTPEAENPPPRPRGTAHRLIAKLLGPERMKLLTQQMYSEYEFWNVLLPRWIVPDSQKSVLEVGSAPGGHLVEFHRLFGYRPFGVEYTESGVESNRRTFLKHGFDPDQVIHADFFAAQFQNEYANRFDAVLSRGFIEHFENVEEVIGHHLHVLKPGGFLIVIIPNLQGMHLRAVRRYAPEMLPLHNLVIMNRDRFRQLFQDPSLDHKFCGYQGGVHLLMGSDVPGNRMPEGKRARLRRVQGVLNLMQGAMGSIDSGQTSPYLLYVGQKRLNPTSPIQR